MRVEEKARTDAGRRFPEWLGVFWRSALPQAYMPLTESHTEFPDGRLLHPPFLFKNALFVAPERLQVSGRDFCLAASKERNKTERILFC
jgi:hypothetical protein